MKKIGLVCTTIGDGSFLEGYCKQAEAEGVKDQVTFYIIMDNNTSLEAYSKAVFIRNEGFDIAIPALVQQEDWLRLWDFELVPWNSDNRRNVGYLKALDDGCEVIISIDDDNFYSSGKFFLEHGIVGHQCKETTVKAHWYNICTHVGLADYPRGFPYNEKDSADEGWSSYSTTGLVAVNEGLWNKDPDFDALTWLSYNGEEPKPNWNGQSFFIGDNTWSPINSQNTAVMREAMVANYFIPMGNTINGMKIDHHADIFTGYFLEACVKKMGHKIRFGTPIVDHIRNNHDYMEDLVKEYACIQMLEDLTEWLHEEKLEGTTYKDCYLSLAERMEDQCEKFTGKIWTIDAKSFIHRTAYCMRRWVKVCNQIGV